MRAEIHAATNYYTRVDTGQMKYKKNTHFLVDKTEPMVQPKFNGVIQSI